MLKSSIMFAYTKTNIHVHSISDDSDSVGSVTLLHVNYMHAIKTYSFPSLEYLKDLLLVLSGLYPTLLIFNL